MPKDGGLAAEACGAEPTSALVLSTGVIGKFLPLDKIDQGIRGGRRETRPTAKPRCRRRPGMLTTDTVHKLAGRTLSSADASCRSPAWPRAPR